MQNQKGFTLIELMIVIAIIAILAAIALPAYNNYAAKSQVTEAISLASSFKTPIGLYVTEEGECPTDGNEGFNNLESDVGEYVEGITFSSNPDGTCLVTAEMGAKANAKVRGKTITITSSSIANSTSGIKKAINKWTCTSSIGSEFLPKSCTSTVTPQQG